jgi:hypothetical protein
MFLVVHKECTESEYIFLCVLCCLMFIDMFHIQMQLMQRQDRWNESVCMYVCMYVCMHLFLGIKPAKIRYTQCLTPMLPN